jgi:putative ABC transport system permease protein
MAVGARTRDILRQFLAEAIGLSLAGGAIGVALGLVVSQVLTRGLGWPTEVTTGSVAIAFAFAGAVGVFFGYYPARRAADLDPIEALRYE